MKNTKNILIITLSILAISLAGYTAFLSYQEKSKPAQQIATPTVEKTVTDNSQDTANIHIFSPQKGDTVGLPIKILGEVRVFENQFSIRIKDKNGKVLVEETAMGENGDAGQYNLFEKSINYPDPKTTEGTIEVFDYSAKDGSEIDKVIVPIKFGFVANALNIEVYFGNSKKDPQMTDCQKVYPVLRRVAYTRETAKIAIEELLKDPTPDEINQGYITSINVGTQLKSVNIKNNTATIDFDQTLQSGVGGSCKVTNIRSQITETVKQFGTINNVIISIDGQTKDILQP
jgi:hypothetical protein